MLETWGEAELTGEEDAEEVDAGEVDAGEVDAEEVDAGGAACGGLSVVPETTFKWDSVFEESGATPAPSPTEEPPHAASNPVTAADTKYMLILELCSITKDSPLQKNVVR